MRYLLSTTLNVRLFPKHLENTLKCGHLVYLPFNNKTFIGYIDKIIQSTENSGDVKSIDSIALLITEDGSGWGDLSFGV